MDKVDNPFLYPIRIPARTSSRYVKTGFLLHIISILLPWFSGLENQVKLIFTLIVLISLMTFSIRFVYYELKSEIIELVLFSDDSWQVKFNGLSYDAEIGPDKFIHPCLCIFKLHYHGKSRIFIVTPDLLKRDDFRRLRVRLRFSQHQ